MTTPNEQAPTGRAALPIMPDLPLTARSVNKSLKFHELPEHEQEIIRKERGK